ncbi:hypothetical protein T439DRAFT_359695 [Meredithblackwellia eburnea MCA 4105]
MDRSNDLKPGSNAKPIENKMLASLAKAMVEKITRASPDEHIETQFGSDSSVALLLTLFYLGVHPERKPRGAWARVKMAVWVQTLDAHRTQVKNVRTDNQFQIWEQALKQINKNATLSSEEDLTHWLTLCGEGMGDAPRGILQIPGTNAFLQTPVKSLIHPETLLLSSSAFGKEESPRYGSSGAALSGLSNWSFSQVKNFFLYDFQFNIVYHKNLVIPFPGSLQDPMERLYMHNVVQVHPHTSETDMHNVVQVHSHTLDEDTYGIIDIHRPEKLETLVISNTFPEGSQPKDNVASRQLFRSFNQKLVSLTSLNICFRYLKPQDLVEFLEVLGPLERRPLEPPKWGQHLTQLQLWTHSSLGEACGHPDTSKTNKETQQAAYLKLGSLIQRLKSLEDLSIHLDFFAAEKWNLADGEQFRPQTVTLLGHRNIDIIAKHKKLKRISIEALHVSFFNEFPWNDVLDELVQDWIRCRPPMPRNFYQGMLRLGPGILDERLIERFRSYLERIHDGNFHIIEMDSHHQLQMFQHFNLGTEHMLGFPLLDVEGVPIPSYT